MPIVEETHVQTDLYEVLGVDRNATQDEIKEHYNELVLIYHPDKGGDAKKFRNLQVAYKILSNEKNREIYTKSLSSTFMDLTAEYRDQKHRDLASQCVVNDAGNGRQSELNDGRALLF